MADTINLDRVNKFYGGVTLDDKDRREGVALVMEEFDVFSNPGYIQPETVLVDEVNYPAVSELIGSYDVDDLGNLWAIVTSNLIRVTNGNNANPGDFAVYASARTTRTSATFQWGAWHGLGNPITTAYFYYIGGTNTLYKTGDLVAAGTTETVAFAALSGIDANTVHIPFKRVDGELFIGHGQYVAKINDAGVVKEKAFTLPNNWHVIGLAPIGDQLAILAKFKSELQTRTFSECRVFLWDKTAATGVDDTFIIPTGGAQVIVNHNEVLRVLTSIAGRLRIWEVSTYPVVTHEMDVFNGTVGGFGEVADTGDFVVSPTSVFIKSGVLYFGVNGPVNTNKSGLYALGRAGPGKPLALVLAKRFTNDIALGGSAGHTPAGAISFGTNIYCAYMRRFTSAEGATATALRVEEANSPTRSSRALYESVWIDGNNLETLKDWEGFLMNIRSMPASTSIRVDARTDNKSIHTISVTSITRSGAVATLTSASAHNLLAGDILVVSGANETQYNGTFTITTVPTTTTLTYAVAGAPATPATGTIIIEHTYDFNSLFTLDNSNDQQETGATADRFYHRIWTSLAGRQIQFRMRPASSGTSAPQIYSFGLLSRGRPII